LGEPRVEIGFTPERNGWAHGHLRIGDSHWLNPSISDITDPLGDLLRAALSLVEGAVQARLSFNSEPMETRWLLKTDRLRGGGSSATLIVRLAEFDSIHEEQPDNAGQTVLSETCTVGEFATAILTEARRLEALSPQSWMTRRRGVDEAIIALERAL
jgi:hypothetical protein